jgi:hypothetical protein
MSSKITLDTTTLIVRNLIVKNPQTEEDIPDNYIPVIGSQGLAEWKDSYEFLGGVNIPSLNNSFLGMLEIIRPGLSSLSTALHSTVASSITSTVAGLGTMGYVSSISLQSTIERLGHIGFVSTTTLFNCINNLGNLTNLANTLKFTDDEQRNFGNVGYVSTLHPGEYKIYQSSLGIQGTNLNSAALYATDIKTSAIIDIGGFSRHIVDSSKMKIDINTNVWITHPQTTLTTVSTFLMKNPLPTNPLTPSVGLPVVMSYNSNTMSLGNVSFLLNSNDISGNTKLLLCHSLKHDGTMTTTIPTTGGIHITLDNTD